MNRCVKRFINSRLTDYIQADQLSKQTEHPCISLALRSLLRRWESLYPNACFVLTHNPCWAGLPPCVKDNTAGLEGDLRKKDQLIEELIKMHPSHGLNKVCGKAILLSCVAIRLADISSLSTVSSLSEFIDLLLMFVTYSLV